MHKDSQEFKDIKKKVGIKDNRTLSKHLLSLRKLNWVGYNPKSGYYFIRSFAFVMEQQGFKGFQAVKCHPQTDLKNFDAFLFATVIGAKVKRFEYFVNRQRWASRFVTNKRGVTNHNLQPSSDLPEYFGLSVATMAKTLKLSHSRAWELKNEAEKHGYLKSNNKFKELVTGSRKVVSTYIGCVEESEAKKIKVYQKGDGIFTVAIQLHDEVIPLVTFLSARRSRQRKYGIQRPIGEVSAHAIQSEVPF